MPPELRESLVRQAPKAPQVSKAPLALSVSQALPGFKVRLVQLVFREPRARQVLMGRLVQLVLLALAEPLVLSVFRVPRV